MINYTEVLETPSKTFQLKQKLSCTNYGIYVATCTICSKQYVGQTINKFSIRWNAHRSIWNSFDANADNDKVALLKHFYKYHDLTQKPPISQCFEVTFVEQTKANYLEECEDKWFHKIDAEIIIKKWFYPIPRVGFLVIVFFPDTSFLALRCDFAIFLSNCCRDVTCFPIPDADIVLHFIAGDSSVFCSLQCGQRLEHFAW